MPDGFLNRYNVTKRNGDPIDPNAIYVLLRVDSGGSDRTHISAGRQAIRAYVKEILRTPLQNGGRHLQDFALELHNLVEQLDYQDSRSTRRGG